MKILLLLLVFAPRFAFAQGTVVLPLCTAFQNSNCTLPGTAVTGTVGVANGGTGATTAAGALSALGAAASGANADITSASILKTITSTVTITTQDLNGYSLGVSSGINASTGVVKAAQVNVGTLLFADGTSQTTKASGEANTYSSTKTFDAAGSAADGGSVKVKYGLIAGTMTFSAGGNTAMPALRFGGTNGFYGSGNDIIESNAASDMWIFTGGYLQAQAQTIQLTVPSKDCTSGNIGLNFYNNSSYGFGRTGNLVEICTNGTTIADFSATSTTFHGSAGLRVDNAIVANGPVTASSATFVGVSISTIVAGGAGSSVTVLCNQGGTVGTFAIGGGCDCSGAVAITEVKSIPNCQTAGCIPTGWTCQEPGGTGGACTAYVICSRLQ